MGEVLAGTVILIAVVSLLVGAAVAIPRAFRASAPEVDTPTYRNHLGMARWIEHVLLDDLERACVPEDRQQAARKLLSAFYNEKETKA